MHRAQRIERKKQQAAPQIIDTRQPKPLPEMAPVDPAVANLPLRTVFFMEVGDMEPARIQLLIQEAGKVYDAMRGGIHYVLPVRHGRIGSDLVFEAEWERVVRETCEVRDGKIVLKDGAAACNIVRQSI